MTQRTCNIIMACKGHINSYGYTPLDHVAEYMSKECACSIELYTKELLENIMFSALCDYLDSCDKPSIFMSDLYNTYKFTDPPSWADGIANALQLVQVKEIDKYTNESKYVNSFTDELINKSMELFGSSIEDSNLKESDFQSTI